MTADTYICPTSQHKGGARDYETETGDFRSGRVKKRIRVSRGSIGVIPLYRRYDVVSAR